MRSLKILLATATVVAAAPTVASAATVDGVYNGLTDEGQEMTIAISRGEPTSVTGATIHRLECVRVEPTQAPPNDFQERPDKTGNFSIDTSNRGGTPGEQFFIGSPESTPTTGDHVFTSGDGHFEQDVHGRTVIKFRMSYEETSESGQEGRRTQCDGSTKAELLRAETADRRVKLRRPKNLQGKVKASVPELASIGDKGIAISATTGPKAVGGTIKVSVKRDTDVKDELKFGNGELGSGSKTVVAGRRTTSFRMDIKRPRRTPSKGDKVPMLVKVEFTDHRGRSRSATTRIVVK